MPVVAAGVTRMCCTCLDVISCNDFAAVLRSVACRAVAWPPTRCRMGVRGWTYLPGGAYPRASHCLQLHNLPAPPLRLPQHPQVQVLAAPLRLASPTCWFCATFCTSWRLRVCACTRCPQVHVRGRGVLHPGRVTRPARPSSPGGAVHPAAAHIRAGHEVRRVGSVGCRVALGKGRPFAAWCMVGGRVCGVLHTWCWWDDAECGLMTWPCDSPGAQAHGMSGTGKAAAPNT